MPTLQYGELLTSCEIFQQETPTRAQEANQRSEAQADKSKHG
jgi:hypothetical protein